MMQWGLVVSACLSSITAVRGLADGQGTMVQFFGENFPVGAIFEWNMKMQFLSLLVMYSLNIIVAAWCPIPILAYLLAAGYFIRIGFVLSFALNAEKVALMGMSENGKLLKIICVIQAVLGAVIAGCTYLSSQDDSYMAYVAGISSAAADAEFGTYLYFVYVFGAIGILGRIPQIINVRTGMARFMAKGEGGLPTDKGKMTVLEFSFGFTAVNFLLTWSFVIFMMSYIPNVAPVATFMTAIGVVFIAQMARTLTEIADLGFALPPMIFFVVLISTMFGASLLALLDYYFDD